MYRVDVEYVSEVMSAIEENLELKKFIEDNEISNNPSLSIFYVRFFGSKESLTEMMIRFWGEDEEWCDEAIELA